MNKKKDLHINSPIPSGSGAVVVHRSLEQGLSNYHLRTFNPKITLVPPLLSIFRDRNSDIIHSSIELAAYLVNPDQYCVSTIHNYYLDAGHIRRSSVLQKIYYLTMLRHQFKQGLKRSNRIVAVSNTTYDLVINDLSPNQVTKEKFVRIINGVDCKRFRPRDYAKKGNIFKILFAGNPTPRKGWPLVVKIADQLPLNCEIVCTTGMRDLKGLPQHSKIKYLQKVPHSDMQKVYQQVDLLLLPSYREGLSLVLLEAMASGLPIVGFNISSMPEAVTEGKGGCLVEPGDIEQLFRTILELSLDEKRCLDYGLYNRDRCKLFFNQKRMIQEYRDVLSDPII